MSRNYSDPPTMRRPPFYYEYIRSLAFKQLRCNYMQRIGWLCERCYIRKAKILHHLDYTRLGHEQPEDLIALCRECHEKWHTWPPLVRLPELFDKLTAANDNKPTKDDDDQAA
jgi:hypothetical protein